MATEQSMLALESGEESVMESPKRFSVSRIAAVVVGAVVFVLAGSALLQHGHPKVTRFDGIIEEAEKPKCNSKTVKVCEKTPFVLCAQATCIASAFSNPAKKDEGLNTAACNCSYMGKKTSAGTRWMSSKYPAAFTNKPFNDICDYMNELPDHGYVLSTFTNERVEYNWPFTAEETAAYTCDDKETVTAQCDGAVCQVMDKKTWTPKLDQNDWSEGDPAVCTCPTVKGEGQTIAGKYEDGACGKPGRPGGPGFVPKVKSDQETFEVMVGAMAGGIPFIEGLLADCTGADWPKTTLCPKDP